MFHETDSFSAVEALIETHAPFLMRVGDDLGRRQAAGGRVACVYRPPIHGATIKRMVRLRAHGATIGNIARTVRVSWRSAWKLSR